MHSVIPRHDLPYYMQVRYCAGTFIFHARTNRLYESLYRVHWHIGTQVLLPAWALHFQLSNLSTSCANESSKLHTRRSRSTE